MRAVHIEVEAVLPEIAVGDFGAPEHLRCTSFGESDPVQGDSDNASKVDLVDQAILQALAFQPFASVPQISCTILLSKST
jgi:hypothetical protein